VLRQIGTAEAARALLFSNIQDDAYLRYRIALAISRIREEHPEVPVDAGRLRAATLRRLRAYRRYVPVFRDLEATLPPSSLLLRVIDDRLEQNLEVVFRLLQLEHGGKALIDAWRTFAAGDARERAYAIELTEHLVDAEMRQLLVPALERYHRLPEAWGGVPARAERAPRRLRELLRSRDAVVRGCAYLTARRSLPGFEGAFSAGAPEGAYVDEAVLERVFFLEGVEILAQCEVDDLVALATIARNRTYRVGESIFVEGGPGDALFVILEGRVRFIKGGSDVISLGAREAFGETSLLDGAPRPVGAVADAPLVRVLHVDRQDFLDLVSDRPELLKGVFAAVTRHLKLVIEVAATARLTAPRGESGGGSAAA
jgi:Cyclic nucleotide-binding domain